MQTIALPPVSRAWTAAGLVSLALLFAVSHAAPTHASDLAPDARTGAIPPPVPAESHDTGIGGSWAPFRTLSSAAEVITSATEATTLAVRDILLTTASATSAVTTEAIDAAFSSAQLQVEATVVSTLLDADRVDEAAHADWNSLSNNLGRPFGGAATSSRP